MKAKIYFLKFSIKLFFVSGLICVFFVYACGKKTEEETIAVSPGEVQRQEQPKEAQKNRPPEVKELSIVPQSPRGNQPVKVSFKCQDPDGDVCRFKIKWFINGEEVVGETGFRLPAGKARKGDIIQVAIYVSDGKSGWVEVMGPQVEVVNTPPQIVEYTVKPSNPCVDDVIEVTVKTQDIDGDDVDLSYTWFLNGEEVDFVDGNTFPAKLARPKDKVEVQVVPFDGDEEGQPVKIGPIEIVNRPPTFVEMPQREVLSRGNVIAIRLKAEDPDGEEVRYSLAGEYPSGMTIDPHTGEILWKIDQEVFKEKKKFNITVLAVDPHGGRASLSFELGY